MAEAQAEAATSLYVPTIDKVVTQAYRRAGLLSVQQNPSTAQLATARDTLNDMVDSLSAEGVFMRAVQVGYVTLVDGQNLYTLPENVFDVAGNGAYIDPTLSQVPFQAQSETPVVMKDRDTWQNLSAKAAQGRPYIGYFAREAPTATLYLWPMPGVTEDGGKIRFQFHVTRPDVTVGTNTLPFERYWTEYFVFGLAARLALDNSLDLGRVEKLEQIAIAKKEVAKGYSQQNVSMQASINHPSAWSRRRR